MYNKFEYIYIIYFGILRAFYTVDIDRFQFTKNAQKSAIYSQDSIRNSQLACACRFVDATNSINYREISGLQRGCSTGTRNNGGRFTVRGGELKADEFPPRGKTTINRIERETRSMRAWTFRLVTESPQQPRRRAQRLAEKMTRGIEDVSTD